MQRVEQQLQDSQKRLAQRESELQGASRQLQKMTQQLQETSQQAQEQQEVSIFLLRTVCVLALLRMLSQLCILDMLHLAHHRIQTDFVAPSKSLGGCSCE